MGTCAVITPDNPVPYRHGLSGHISGLSPSLDILQMPGVGVAASCGAESLAMHDVGALPVSSWTAGSEVWGCDRWCLPWRLRWQRS